MAPSSILGASLSSMDIDGESTIVDVNSETVDAGSMNSDVNSMNFDEVLRKADA